MVFKYSREYKSKTKAKRVEKQKKKTGAITGGVYLTPKGNYFFAYQSPTKKYLRLTKKSRRGK